MKKNIYWWASDVSMEEHEEAPERQWQTDLTQNIISLISGYAEQILLSWWSFDTSATKTMIESFYLDGLIQFLETDIDQHNYKVFIQALYSYYPQGYQQLISLSYQKKQHYSEEFTATSISSTPDDLYDQHGLDYEALLPYIKDFTQTLSAQRNILNDDIRVIAQKLPPISQDIETQIQSIYINHPLSWWNQLSQNIAHCENIDEFQCVLEDIWNPKYSFDVSTKNDFYFLAIQEMFYTAYNSQNHDICMRLMHQYLGCEYKNEKLSHTWTIFCQSLEYDTDIDIADLIAQLGYMRSGMIGDSYSDLEHKRWLWYQTTH